MAIHPDAREALSDRYQIGRQLGTGSTATVYLATDLKYQRQVAIKLLRPELTVSMAAERFLREIAIAAKLQHPHILSLLDSGTAAESLYFVMPFLAGETLREKLNRDGRLSIADTIRIVSDVADALAYAHGQGIVHRDIKPDNIMIVGRHAIIMDFGVSKAVNASVVRHLTGGLAIGTPTYMAPEQALANDEVDHRADLYSLGVTAFEMLAGRPPFEGATPQEVLTAHVVTRPEPVTVSRPETPVLLAGAVMRCLAKQPDERWPNAAAIAAALDPLATPGAASPPAQSPPTSWRPSWRLVSLALLGLVVVSALLRWPSKPAGSSSTIQQSTYLGNVVEAAVSPDGQFIAFVVADSASQHLLVRDEVGTRPIEIATGVSLKGISWIDQGSALAFSARTDQGWTLKRIPRLGGIARTIGRDPALVSPNGRYAVSADPAGKILTITNLVGGDTTTVARNPTYSWVAGIGWAPESDRLLLALTDAVDSRNALETVGLNGERFLTRVDSVAMLAPRFSGDGQSVEYVRGNAIYRLRIDHTGRARGPVELVFAGLSFGYDEARSPFLGSLSTDPAGRTFVLQVAVASNLAIRRLDQQSPSPLTPITQGTAQYFSPRFSPGGDRVAAIRRSARGHTVVVIPTTGGEATEMVTFNEAIGLDWSPDERSVGVMVINPVHGVALVALDQGTVRQVGVGRVGARLSWGPDRIVLQGLNNLGLLSLDPSTKSISRISAVDSTEVVVQPLLSPDGRWIAYATNRSGASGLGFASTTDTSSTWARIGPFVPLRWSRGSDTVFAIGQGMTRRLVAVPRIGGSLRILASVTGDQTIADVAPDGQSMLIIQERRQADLWRIDPPKKGQSP